MQERAVLELNTYYKSMTNDDIYHALKEDILSLKLKPGQMISENEISRNYNVSRTPVKTAFLRLMGEKYIDIIPQRGSYVTLLDMQYIRDIIYMRTVLEVDILTTIVEDLDVPVGFMEKMEANLEAQKALISNPDIIPRDFYTVDSQFHYLMFQCAGRAKMWDVIQDCQVYYTRFRILDTLTTARYHQLFQEHLEIYQSIKNKDVQAVRHQVYEHLHGNIKILGPRIEGEFKEYFSHT